MCVQGLRNCIRRNTYFTLSLCACIHTLLYFNTSQYEYFICLLKKKFSFFILYFLDYLLVSVKFTSRIPSKKKHELLALTTKINILQHGFSNTPIFLLIYFGHG